MPFSDERRQHDLQRFLAELICQEGDCGAVLSSFPDGAVCSGSDAHYYSMEGTPGYLVLTNRHHRDAAPEVSSGGPPYANVDYALRYAGLWSFPYATLVNHDLAAQNWIVGRGESESFYRSISSIAIQSFGDRTPEMIWDIGCG